MATSRQRDDRTPGRHEFGYRPSARLCERILDGNARITDVAKPLPEIFLQAPRQELPDRTGVFCGSTCQSGSRCRTFATVSGAPSAVERTSTGQHLEQDAAERPDVGPPVDLSPARLLGTHVGRRPHHGAFFRGDRGDRSALQPPSSLSVIRPRQTEVEHLDGPVAADLDVGRLEIAVDDALLVRALHCVGDLAARSSALRGDRVGRARYARRE